MQTDPGTQTATRTFTSDDIAECGALTGDFGSHHVSGIAGRQMAQGMLTLAVAPLFADDTVHVREMSVKFLAPVFAGDTVTATTTVTGREQLTDTTTQLACTVVATNGDGTEVLRGTAIAEIVER